MNYAHNLIIGSVIKQNDPAKLQQLAQHAEQLGYDFINIPDAPQQAELDAWTILSWLAASTKNIKLSATLDATLQLPSMISNAAASLDLLSNGRLIMALAANLSPQELSELSNTEGNTHDLYGMLDETVDILYGMWDGSSNSAVTYHGDYFRLAGQQRGPLPSHNVPVWISGVHPTILSIAAQKADGWIGDIKQLNESALSAALQAIDMLAEQTDRDPREIRRLLTISGQFSNNRQGQLHGTTSDWVADLLPLVADHGISGLILDSDDAETMSRFANEVVPALREAVLGRDPNAFSSGVMRRSAARAKRQAGINYDAIPSSLVELAIEPGDVNYARVKSTYMRGGAPGLVLRARNTAEVVDALAFARQHRDLPLSIRSGGHGISGRSTNRGGIVIDLGLMNAIEVIDREKRLVRVQPGARWMEVAAALAPYGWALSSGDYGGVGVGGLATAGGIGFLSREHGLTIDHIRSVEMVLADGSVVNASETENPELFWGVRGAGANFGIVTSFVFEVDPVGDMGWAQFIFDATNTAQFLQAWGAAVEAAPRQLTSFATLVPARSGQPAIASVFTLVDSNVPDEIIGMLQPIANAGPLYDQAIYLTSYVNIISNASPADHSGQGEPIARSGLLKHITPEFAQAAERFLHSGATYFFQFRAVGGAVSDVAEDATAYAFRDANFSVSAMGARREFIDRYWTDLSQYFEGLYLNFETDSSPRRLKQAFPPATLQRLQALKRQVDPSNLFRDNFNIDPEMEF